MMMTTSAVPIRIRVRGRRWLDHQQHRLVGEEGIAQIALHCQAQPLDVLDGHGLIQAQVLGESPPGRQRSYPVCWRTGTSGRRRAVSG